MTLPAKFASETIVTIVAVFLAAAASNWPQGASGAINSVLDLNNTFPYLINKTSGQVIEPRDYLDFDNLYTPDASFKIEQSAQKRNYYLLKAFDFANYYQSDYWHYSDEADLRRSAEPVANSSKCSRQLNWLEETLNRSESVLFKQGEQHTNLVTLLDSFGHAEAATYFGHGYWLGSYYECLKSSLDTHQFELEECKSGNRSLCDDQLRQYLGQKSGRAATATTIKFRYCIGKGHEVDWPSPQEDDYIPRVSYKIGLCLPETCETLSFGRHKQLIERLMRLNLPKYMQNRIGLHDVYCLPDNRSPIRSLSLSARVFLGICAGWLLLLVAATFVYSCYEQHKQDVRCLRDLRACSPASPAAAAAAAAAAAHKQHDATARADCSRANGFAPTTDCDNNKLEAANQNGRTASLLSVQVGQHQLLAQDDDSPQASPLGNLIGGVATNSTKRLDNLSGSTTSSLSYKTTSSLSNWLIESPKVIKLFKALSISQTLREFLQPPQMLTESGSSERLRVNLNALDAIKCLCCILVIFGHIIFIHMQHLSNIVHTIELSHELATRPLIAFFNFVDTFFIISGMLTSYFIFKRFNKKSFSSPIVWLYISGLRLLRLSPVYLLVFWYVKTLSVYIGDGPIWDYGTDRQSIKGLCINDSWWKSLLYLGNYGTMQPLCILPAWSIIVDSQYSLVIPIVLYLIFKRKRLAYVCLLAGVVVSTAKMSIQLANQTAVKPSDMAKIRLHVYPLISRFAAEFYNTAWNRIGPVAIGIAGGHLLYLYDVGKIRNWPWYLKGVIFKIVLFLHLFIFMLPIIGRYTDSPDSTSQDNDMTIFVLSNASIKPIWSLINTIFLLRLITDLRQVSVLARLMSHNIWHCLGKLCFTSYLIHYEIILTMLKSRQDGLLDPNWLNVLREFSAVFLISTVISYCVYIAYEAPVNKLIMLLFANQNARHNNKKSQQGHTQAHIVLNTTTATTFQKCEELSSFTKDCLLDSNQIKAAPN